MDVFSVNPMVSEIELSNDNHFKRRRIKSIYADIEFIVQNSMHGRVKDYFGVGNLGYVERAVWNSLFPFSAPYTCKQTIRTTKVNGVKIRDIIEHVKFNIYYGFPTLERSDWFTKEYTNRNGNRTRMTLQDLKFMYNTRTHTLQFGFSFLHQQWDGVNWFIVH
jgi:hypothetical protein